MVDRFAEAERVPSKGNRRGRADCGASLDSPTDRLSCGCGVLDLVRSAAPGWQLHAVSCYMRWAFGTSSSRSSYQ